MLIKFMSTRSRKKDLDLKNNRLRSRSDLGHILPKL